MSQEGRQGGDNRFSSSSSMKAMTNKSNMDEGSRQRVIIEYLRDQLATHRWYSNNPAEPWCGVLLRISRGVYVSEPDVPNPSLLAAVQKINPEVAYTMSTRMTKLIASQLHPQQSELVLSNGSLLQVIDSLADIVMLPSSAVKKYQYGALLRQEQMLLVWHDSVDKLFSHSMDLEARLMALVWGSSLPTSLSLHQSALPSVVTTPTASLYHLPMDTKAETSETITAVYPAVDEEAAKQVDSLDRPLAVASSIYTALGVFTVIVLLVGFNVSSLIFESLVDGKWIRMALIVTTPFLCLLSLFFFFVIWGDIFQVVGPIKSLQVNSRFYSPHRPDLAMAYAQGFSPPRITIQMPVYTESLEGVIIPTVTSLKETISHYESHGGTATILVNDDGLAYLSEEEAQRRIDFYHDNNIAWVARPKNDDERFNYVRKGKFKKASNMNFALNASNKVEDELLILMGEKLGQADMIDPIEEEIQYRRALETVLASDPRIRAGGDIRVGEIILIVDSDTRVPKDCLLMGAAEMFLSPEVAIIQHSTGVMQVTGDYFENGITYFTNLVYSSIRFAVGNGEVAPFVGHNAFLRWQAVQSVGNDDPDGYVAYWSESHVSEDFDMALRLQIHGNVVRLASYHGADFKEGVSLTIYDELARWEKYAYGCNELVFNPMYTWPWKGPFSKLFRTFLFSNLQLSSKLTILGYISSYYALAVGFPLTVLNYFLVGWFLDDLDEFYMQSWKVYLSLLVVFTGAGNVAFAVLRYRLSEKTLLGALVENFKWAPLFSIFFGGLSFHLNLALLAHMFSINMTWGTTAKEKDDSNFFKEIPKIAKSFKWMYAVVIPAIGAMIYLGCFAPHGWRINSVAAVVPLASTLISHALLPFVLNPALMVFNY